MAKKRNTDTTPINSIRHQGKRKNIPTEELRDFVKDDELKPKVLLYPRDPSLDPQLVWKGKDEQDRSDLEVPAVPIYIQEKIHPQAIIEDLRLNPPIPTFPVKEKSPIPAFPVKEKSPIPAFPVNGEGEKNFPPLAGGIRGGREPQINLFSDFNGLSFDKMVDFYQHGVNWSNRMILGDSLLVMNSLAEKEGLRSKVQMIYLDPPYGIKFNSNWQVSTRKRDVKDGKAEDATRQPEQIRAFRDTWKLGIHSYLAYLRDRLVVAKELLTETGSVFVQIGDENVHLVRCLMDEVFGSENYICQIICLSSAGLNARYLQSAAIHLLWYAHDLEKLKYKPLFTPREVGVGRGTGMRFDQLESPDGKVQRSMTTKEKDDPSQIPSGWKAYKLSGMYSDDASITSTVDFKHNGKVYHPGMSRHWKTTVTGLNRLATSDRLQVTSNSLNYKRFIHDFPAISLDNIWDDVKAGEEKVYVVQTVRKITERCLLMTTDPGDLVLDPTCVRKGTRVLTPLNPPTASTTPLNPPASGGTETPSPLAGKVGMGFVNPAKVGMGSVNPAKVGMGFVNPAKVGMGSVNPAKVGMGSVPIESLHPGDWVYAHDGLPHRVLRLIKRKYQDVLIGLHCANIESTLWITPDHLVLSERRVKAFSAEGGWSAVPKEHFGSARILRKQMSPPERILWNRLRRQQTGGKFRRQHPIGPYIADFYSRESALVVEVDGSQHGATLEAVEYDQARDEYMEGLGLQVMRIPAAKVLGNPEEVFWQILETSREKVLQEDSNKQWRFAAHVKVGDIVYRGDDQIPVQVVSIETQTYDGEVYDLEVENAHSFVTEVCTVHNCGSGTTAYVAEQWGRRWITVDTSRVALALARTRLMAAKYPYYLMTDSIEGAGKEKEITGLASPLSPPVNGGKQGGGDIRKGFVYKRVPHVTLKSIANNEEIDAIHAKWQEKLEPLREQINRSTKSQFEEWQVPREAAPTWSEAAKKALTGWWELRRQRQQEIDASIARRAETEILYDQPYEDNKRVRVTGPFTVESISPHRVLSLEEKHLAAEGKVVEGVSVKTFGPSEFVRMILDNLKKAGVQNTYKNERLKFDRLEPFAGEYLSAAGEYTEKEGKSQRVAVCIGPEYGTVGADLVKDAAKEAVKGVGFDLLIVCGFAFDPHVNEEAKRYGKLTVLMARMNNDLSMGNELLKKTGAGNLFTVFGEPDLQITTQPDGKLVVEVKELDTYDPTTGEIRNSSTDDIACWFIDTDYNDESFFVRHAYFCGNSAPSAPR